MTQTNVKNFNRNLYIGIAVVIIIAIIGVYWYMMPKTVTYTVSLTGANEVPAVTTTATGQCTFTVSSDGKVMHFVLTVNNLSDITASHIHLGVAGQNGPVIVALYAGPVKTGSFTGTLAESDITASNLVGTMLGKSMSDLVENINKGMCYVNIHTSANPSGAIRGMIQK